MECPGDPPSDAPPIGRIPAAGLGVHETDRSRFLAKLDENVRHARRDFSEGVKLARMTE